MTQNPKYDLYAFWRSSATYRVRVALNLKGVSASEHFVNIDAGEQRSAEFLKINPLAAIPALVEAGHAPITQSLAILEFLDEMHPAPALLPNDAYGRARVRSFCQMLAADTHPLVTGRIKKYLVGTGHFDDASFKAWQTNWFTTGLTALEQRLAHDKETGKFCHGDQIGMADICLVSILAVMRVFKITVPGTPTIDRIVAACDAHEAFAKAAPYLQHGAPVQT